jgi:hypothetical protein
MPCFSIFAIVPLGIISLDAGWFVDFDWCFLFDASRPYNWIDAQLSNPV